MAKVYAIICYHRNRETGNRTEHMANSAVWRNRYDALAEVRRQLEGKTYETITATDTKTGKETPLGYRWKGSTTDFEYIVSEWPVF